MIRILAILCCFITLEKDKPVVFWQENNMLTWENFKGEPKLNSVAVAETVSGISFGFSVKKRNADVVSFSTEVNAYFYPEESWFDKKRSNPYILKHEQLHFDITELFARKFRKGISELKVSNHINDELKVLYQNNETGLIQFQKRYDEETNHSENFDIQKKWQLYVKSELDKLSKYKSIEQTSDSR